MPIDTTPDNIIAGLQHTYDGDAFKALDPLTFDVLAAQERGDWREHQGWPSSRWKAELRREVEKLGKAVARLGRVGRRQARRATQRDRKLLLSKAEAARLLGIDAKTQLERLIADKHIRAVKAPHGLRIPRSEVLRLVDDGIPDTSALPRRKPPKAPPPPGVGDQIR